MELVIFELASLKDTRLNCDFLLDGVGEIVIDGI